tara:strand:- start:5299 stop:5469 length:171 start_codon:yes stop_codon:yes gene_type:complete
MDWDNKSDQEKTEYMGFLFFNRCGEEDWLDFNSMVCTLEDNLENDKEDSDNLGAEY